jgi:hypothetical protein
MLLLALITAFIYLRGRAGSRNTAAAVLSEEEEIRLNEILKE